MRMMRVVQISPSNTKLHCRHCGTYLLANVETEFCCDGCCAAFAFVQDLGLERYYQLKDTKVNAPAPVDFADFGAFNSAEFITDYGQQQVDGSIQIRFHVDGLHCFGCVWLCEGVAQKIAPSAHVAVNFASNTATVTFKPDAVDLQALAQAFSKLGHLLTPLQDDQQAWRGAELIRLGVAAFCAMNTMSFALVDYFAAPGTVEPEFDLLLRFASWVLATVSMVFSAGPIFRAGLAAMLRGRPGVDTGVAVALAAAYLFSSWHVLAGGLIYFDSVTAIIALLLTGRLLQHMLIARIENQLVGSEKRARYIRRLGKNATLAHESGQKTEFTALENLRCADLFVVLPGETIPLTSEVVSGTSEVNLEPITGEARPAMTQLGTRVQAGAINISRPLTLRALEDGYRCYLLQSECSSKRLMADKGRLTALADRLAGKFFWVSLAVAVSAFVFSLAHADLSVAVQRTVAVLLVACPCVFGFAAPLAFATGGARGLNLGVAFRNQGAIEALAATETIVFDKTGTLTLGQPVVTAALQVHLPTETRDRARLRALIELAAASSHHHVPRAISAWARENLPAGGLADGGVVEEKLGEGLEVKAHGHVLRLGKPAFVGSSEQLSMDYVHCMFDGQLAYAFCLNDCVHPESLATVKALRAMDFHLLIMSGDHQLAVRDLSAQLNIAAASDLSPTGKALAVRHLAKKSQVAMVGNGFNDSQAMGRAQVGIAVENASSAAKAAADVRLLRPGIQSLVDAITLSRGTVRAVYRAFAFAATYNGLAMILAVSGYVSPVVAALLMPANSMAVTLIATRWRVTRL